MSNEDKKMMKELNEQAKKGALMVLFLLAACSVGEWLSGLV